MRQRGQKVRCAPPPIPPQRGAAHWRTARAVVRQCLRWRALARIGALWRALAQNKRFGVPNVCAECRIKSVQLSGQQQCACVHFSAHSYFKGKR